MRLHRTGMTPDEQGNFWHMIMLISVEACGCTAINSRQQYLTVARCFIAALLVAHDKSQHCQAFLARLAKVYTNKANCLWWHANGIPFAQCVQRIGVHKSITLAVVASLAKRHTPLNAVLEMVPFLELMSCVLLFEPAETVLQAAAYHQLLPSSCI